MQWLLQRPHFKKTKLLTVCKKPAWWSAWENVHKSLGSSFLGHCLNWVTPVCQAIMGRDAASHSADLRVTLLHPNPHATCGSLLSTDSHPPTPFHQHSLCSLEACAKIHSPLHWVFHSHHTLQFPVWTLFSFSHCHSPLYLLGHYAYRCKAGRWGRGAGSEGSETFIW